MSHSILREFVSALCTQEAFPQWELPPGEKGGGKPNCDNSKAAAQLGLQLTPLRETFVDMARTLVALGIAKPKSK